MSVYTETDSPPENQSETVSSEDLSSESPAQSTTPLEGEALENALRHQLEWYFSKQNLANDAHLVSRMNSQGYVPIDVIADFRRVKNLTTDRELLLKVMRTCASVALDETGTLVKPNIKMERTTLILRDISSSTPVEDVKKIFESEQCPKTVNIRADVGDTWFVTFETQEACLDACLFAQGQTFQGKPVSCRVKSENLLRGFFYGPNPTTTGGPVGDAANNNNRGSTLPPNGYYGGVPMAYMNSYNPYSQPNRTYNQQWANHNNASSFPNKHISSKTSTGSQSPTSEYKGGRGGASGGDRRNKNTKKPGKNEETTSPEQTNFPSITTPIPLPPNAGAGRGSRKKGDKPSPDKANGRRTTDSTVQPQITSSQHFPPLPKKKASAGYASAYQKYDRDQMAEIVSRLNQEGFSKPATYPSADKCVIVRSDPLLSCQLLEPFPVMYPASPSPLLAAQPNHSSMPYFDLNALTYFELPPASIPPTDIVTGVPDLSLGPSQSASSSTATTGSASETVATSAAVETETTAATTSKPKSKKNRSRAASSAEEKGKENEDNTPAKPVSFAGAVGAQAEKKDDSAQAKSRAAKAAAKQSKPAQTVPKGRARGKSRDGKPPVQSPPTSDKPKPASKPQKAAPKTKGTRTPEVQDTSPTPAAPRSAWTAAAAAPPKPKPSKSDKPVSPTSTHSTVSTANQATSSSASSSNTSTTSRKSKSESTKAESKPLDTKAESSSAGKPFSWAEMAKKADKSADKSPPGSATTSPAKKPRAEKR